MRLNFLSFLILVIVVGASVGGAYGAGIAMGKGQAPAPTPAQSAPGAVDTSAAGSNSRGGFSGQGLTGTVEKVEGNILTISTQSGGSTQVTLADDTTIRKTADAGKEELKQGVRVVVVGQQGSGGSVTASSIQIVAADGATPGQQPVQQPRSKPQSAPTSAP